MRMRRTTSTWPLGGAVSRLLFASLLATLVTGSLALNINSVVSNNNGKRGDSPTVSVSPSELTAMPIDRVSVVIDYGKDTQPEKDDFLGIFWPAKEDPKDFFGAFPLKKDSHDVPGLIGWKVVSESEKTAKSAGNVFTIDIPLVFGRALKYNFALFSQNGTRATAVSRAVGWRKENAPSQVRLSIPGKTTSSAMRVLWTHSEPPSHPVVEYRSSSHHSWAKATCRTYAAGDLCAAPANNSRYFRSPGFFCDAVMGDLVVGAKYTYRVGGNGTSEELSEWFSFVAPPVGGTQAALDSHVSVVMYGDLGVAPPFYTNTEQQPPSMKTMKWVLEYLDSLPENHLKLTWHIGDISYARGHAFLWEWFSALIQRAATQSPYHVCIGNHEYDYLAQPWRPKWSDYGSDSGGECGVPYGVRFHMPDNGRLAIADHFRRDQSYGGSSRPSGAIAMHADFPGNEKLVRNLWFSHDHGPVHWVAMSTEHDFLPGSPQFDFLKADLAGVDRSKTPWIILVGHRPM
jgi:acid phosphatase type 7